MHCRKTPIVLVGAMIDLREDDKNIDSVTELEGRTLMQEIGASYYTECSALTQQGVFEVFECAVRAFQKKTQQSKKCRCHIF